MRTEACRWVVLCACLTECATFVASPGSIAQPVEVRAPSATKPAGIVPVRPADESSARAFDLFNEINRLCREGKIEKAAQRIKPQKGTSAAELQSELKDIGDEQRTSGRHYLSIDAKAQGGVAMVIIGREREDKSIHAKDALGAILADDGSWLMLMEEPQDYDEGELTAEQTKAFAALAQWAEARMAALRDPG